MQLVPLQDGAIIDEKDGGVDYGVKLDISVKPYPWQGCQIGYTDHTGCHQSAYVTICHTRVVTLPGVSDWFHGAVINCMYFDRTRTPHQGCHSRVSG
jgi:hypothetical protein